VSRARRLALVMGHLAPFGPPILLLATAALAWWPLAFVSLIVVAPVLRVLFGDARRRMIAWPESLANSLETVPPLTAILHGIAIAFVVARAGADGTSGGDAWWPIECALSLWATFMFAVCASHELLHRRSTFSTVLGRLLSGALGYPFLEHEHRLHHLRAGAGDGRECADVTEDVWRFSARRLSAVVCLFGQDCKRFLQCRDVRGLWRLGVPLISFAIVLIACAMAGPWCLAAYGAAVAGVAIGVQFINYIQHWGLGAATGMFSWEDRCRLQASLTFGISYHQSHHDNDAIPYYRLQPREGAPQLPAGYVILMILATLPSMWRGLMLPALEAWRSGDPGHRSPGRQLMCFSRKRGRANDESNA